MTYISIMLQYKSIELNIVLMSTLTLSLSPLPFPLPCSLWANELCRACRVAWLTTKLNQIESKTESK